MAVARSLGRSEANAHNPLNPWALPAVKQRGTYSFINIHPHVPNRIQPGRLVLCASSEASDIVNDGIQHRR